MVIYIYINLYNVLHVANVNDMNVQTEIHMVDKCERQTDHQYNNVFNKFNALMFCIILVLVLILLLLFTVIHYAKEFRTLQHQLLVLSTAQSACVLNNDTITKMLLKYKPLSDYEQDFEDTKFQGTDSWYKQLEVSNKDQYQVTPAILNIKNESKNNNFILSSPFFTFKEGHLMIMRVYPNGVGRGEGTHMSVLMLLMKGPHDDELEQSGHWPLRGTFTIELLNQFNDSDHCIHKTQFHHHLCNECTNRVLNRITAKRGFGHERFISLDILQHSNSAYYNNGSLAFRISYEDVEPPFQVAPVTFKLTDFSQWLDNKEVWYSSSPFFAFDGGYQMILRVDAAGYGENKNPHVSAYLYLIKGPYDDELEQSGHWPLKGEFTIELIDQYNTSYYDDIYLFSNETCIECTNRVMHENGRGKRHGGYFISHNDLYNYYNSETLYFRVSYNSCYFCAIVYTTSLTVLIKLPAVVIINSLIMFEIMACIETFRAISKIRSVAIILVVIRYDLIFLIFLMDAIKSSIIMWTIFAVDILSRLIWEFTGIISYQTLVVIDAAIARIIYVYFSSKAVYFYTSSHTNQTFVILSPIMLALISDNDLIFFYIVLICNCIFNLVFVTKFI